MTNYFELLKTIYTKERLAIAESNSDCIALTKTLAKDQSNLKELKSIVKYLFLISPESYFYLLYFFIPKKPFVPKSLKIEKVEVKESKLLNRIKEILDWSDREFEFNRNFIKVKDESYWEKELGIS